MKNTFIFIIFLLIANVLFAQNKSVKKITGYSYLTKKKIAIFIKDGQILRIENLKTSNNDEQKLYIAPGLIDIQINGYMGVDFTGPVLNEAGILKATKALWKEGVTTYLPTVITNSNERLLNNFAILSDAMKNKKIVASVPGFHLEGPYISPVKGFRGAHLEKYIRKADFKEFKNYQKAANGHIKFITVAPEMEDALDFIKQVSGSGVKVSLGHHNGTAPIIEQAVNAGASLSTHLGNGCANMINRHHNPIWPQLANDNIAITIIVDGFHLTKEEVISFYKAKGTNNTILVSDALDLAGLEPGEYIRGERKVLLTPNVIKFPEENVLAGAASPLRLGVGNMMRFTGCSLAEAIQMASTNPANKLGIKNVGELKEGKRANIILFTLENMEMKIKETYLDGELVYKAN